MKATSQALRRTLLLIDSMPVCYQSQHATGSLRTKDGRSTGVTYGFLRALRSYWNGVGAATVITVWDSKGPVFKAERTTAYKANRPPSEARDRMYKEIPQLRQVLADTFYGQAHAEGYEADDILATLAKVATGPSIPREFHQILGFTPYDQAVIVTVDRDVFQAVRDSSKDHGAVMIYWIAPKDPKDRKILRSSDVLSQTQFLPEDFVFAKALLGDPSDNVRGISRDLKTLNKLLDSLQCFIAGGYHGDQLEAALDELVMNELGQEASLALQANKEVLRLVDVPPDAIVFQQGTADPYSLSSQFQDLEFQSLLARLDDYIGESTPEGKWMKEGKKRAPNPLFQV